MPTCVYERAFQNNALDYPVLTLCMFCSEIYHVPHLLPCLGGPVAGVGGLPWARHTPHSLLFPALFSRAGGKGNVV